MFAGAGGLSLGFSQTNRVNIVAAAESSDDARKTYKRNFHIDRIYNDVRTIDYDELAKATGRVDIVIGGPPCQGFSNANRQHSAIISLNNRLVKEYVRAILALNPKAFLMENVAMLKSQVHRFMLEDADLNDDKLKSICLSDEHVEILPKDACFEGALDFVRSLASSENSALIWDKELYKIINLLYRYRINPPKFDDTLKRHKKKLLPQLKSLIREKDQLPSLSELERSDSQMADILLMYEKDNLEFDYTINAIEKSIMLQRAIMRMGELNDNNIHIFDFKEDTKGIFVDVKSYSVLDYIYVMLEDDYNLSKNIFNALDYGAPQKRERFIIVGLQKKLGIDYKPPSPLCHEGNYRTVRDAISDLQDLPVSLDNNDDCMQLEPLQDCSSLIKELRGNLLYNHVATKTRKTALERFKALREGQNFHDLDENLKTTYSNAGRTQNTIYMRLKYDTPCGTVVNVRKSMWIHPKLDRAISIREAARLQTFPDSFVFKGSKDHQYQQVGNAVPPILAREIAKSIIGIMDKTVKKS